MDQADSHPRGPIGPRGGDCNPRDLVRRYPGRRIQLASRRRSERSGRVLWRGLARDRVSGASAAAPPIAGLGALANLLVGGRPEIAATLLTVVARWWRLWPGPSGSPAGPVPAAVPVTSQPGSTSPAPHQRRCSAPDSGPCCWPAGPLPWVLDAVLAPASGDWRRRLGRYARGGSTAGLVAATFPPAPARGSGRRDSLGRMFTRRWFAVVTGLG